MTDKKGREPDQIANTIHQQSQIQLTISRNMKERELGTHTPFLGKWGEELLESERRAGSDANP